MSVEKNKESVYKRLKAVGQAISRINGNNTHSGNLSMRDPDDRDLFYITSSGAQCGALVAEDIVPVKFSGVSWGDARASTESTVHRGILSIPGVKSAMHAHYLYSTFLSLDTKEKQLFLQYLEDDEKGREKFAFNPVDLFGASVIGMVRVDDFFQPVGSVEMERRIPGYLRENHIMVVKGHGVFVRGCCPEDLLYRAGMLESSAKLAINLRRRGVNVVDIGKKVSDVGVEKFFGLRAHEYDFESSARKDVDDSTVLFDFSQRLAYNYENQISSYGTGSMSQKVSDSEMIYCPTSAVPAGFEYPLLKVKLKLEDDDSTDMRMHKLIYTHTHQTACMITTNPIITAEGMALLAEQYGIGVISGEKVDVSYTKEKHPMIVPIDAEAKYLNPRLGLVDISQLKNETADNPIFNMLRWYKGCCVVAGYGVISTGKTTLEQAAHNASSAERIGQFRIEAYINEKMLDGPPLQLFEPV